MNSRLLAAGLLMIAMGCQKQPEPPVPAAETKPADGAHDRPETKGKAKGKSKTLTPPENWSIDELAKYLNQNGVPVSVRPYPQNKLPDRTAFNFYTGTETEPCILVYHCRDTSLAKDTAATMGPDAFAAGRFALGYLTGFQSEKSKQLLAKVKDGLR